MTLKSLSPIAGLLFILLSVSAVFGQAGYKSESDLLRAAKKLFDARDFEKALPLYSQAVSNSPQNSEYNYRLGVCMVEAGRDKSEGVRFLEVARLSPQVNPDVDYYLGIALHHAARFEESITALERFKQSGASKDKQKSADDFIRYGTNALEAQSDLSADRNDLFGDKKVTEEGIPAACMFADNSGKIMKAPADFEDKNCDNNMACTNFFLSKDGSTVVMSRYAGKEKGYDVYIMTKSKTGKWSEPIPFGPEINTAANEAFPTLSGDGRTLYFSSDGPKSSGGYDIFKSDLQTATGKWSAPSHLGFPVNSPGNDFYYVISNDKSKAYFTSDRAADPGTYRVFEAAVSHDTRQFMAIEGVFNCPQCIDGTSASITIVDPETMGAVAHVRSQPGSNIYRLKLYIPGDFIYQVEANGFSFSQQLTNLEDRGEGKRRINQELILRRDDTGAEKLVIVNKYPGETGSMPVADALQVPETVVNTQASANKPASAEPKAAAAKTTAAVSEPVVKELPAASAPAPDKAIKNEQVVPVHSDITTAPVASVTQTEPSKATPQASVVPDEVTANAKQPAAGAEVPAKDESAVPSQPVSTTAATLPATPAPVQKRETTVTGIPAAVPAPVSEPTAEHNSVPVFRIQLGAYFSADVKELKTKLKGKVPADAEYIKNTKGYIQVVSGNMPDYESAKLLKEQLIAAGYAGAFIVVFDGDQQQQLATFVHPEPAAE
ncbi:MAG TPA: tetratricopeptide repeat protein [Bacteroidia bacterium]|nr:tetratricopeptide repeat protein [Bacteroidia bacterium]